MLGIWGWMLSKCLLILKNCTDILEIMHNQISLVDEDSKIPVLRMYTINWQVRMLEGRRSSQVEKGITWKSNGIVANPKE